MHQRVCAGHNLVVSQQQFGDELTAELCETQIIIRPATL